MLQAIVSSTHKSTHRAIHRTSVVQSYDPYSWITGTPTRSDDFTTLALDAAVNARTLPGGGGTWVADAEWIGAGDGKARATTNGKAAKGNVTHQNCKVRMVWDPGATGNNQLSVFSRDIQSTAFIRYGHLVSTYPANIGGDPAPAQAIALYRSDDFVFTNLSGFVSAKINRGLNVLELRCVGSTISCYLNGDKLIEMTDATYNASRSRWGFIQTNITNTDARVDYVDFTLL